MTCGQLFVSPQKKNGLEPPESYKKDPRFTTVLALTSDEPRLGTSQMLHHHRSSPGQVKLHWSWAVEGLSLTYKMTQNTFLDYRNTTVILQEYYRNTRIKLTPESWWAMICLCKRRWIRYTIPMDWCSHWHPVVDDLTIKHGWDEIVT